MEELILKVIQQEAEAIKKIPVSGDFKKATELIFNRVHLY